MMVEDQSASRRDPDSYNRVQSHAEVNSAGTLMISPAGLHEEASNPVYLAGADDQSLQACQSALLRNSADDGTHVGSLNRPMQRNFRRHKNSKPENYDLEFMANYN